MLITKTVMTQWNVWTKEWYENKGYVFTKYSEPFEVKVEDLSNGSVVKVAIECDGCGEILTGIPWNQYLKAVHEDGKYYCQKCTANIFSGIKQRMTKLKNSKSFYQWCYDNFSKKEADIIIDRWDYKLNIDRNGNVLDPNEVGYASRGLNNKGFWFKCLNNSNHTSEQKNITSFTQGVSIDCIQCNSISVTNPELVKFLINKSDAKIHSHGSKKKLPMKCPDCGFEKEMTINDLRRQGFGCTKCSDGISYPNKFMFSILEQIQELKNIEFFEAEKTFYWLIYEFKGKTRKGKLDFYFEINDKSYGAEMDGEFHTKNNNLSGQTKEESKFIDDEKDRLCEEHGIKVIRINCAESKLEWIRKNIMTSKLPMLLNFKESEIDWLKCHEFACSSLVKVCCDMWNNGINSALEISKILKFNRVTAIKYLKQGKDLGWCDYNSKEELRNKKQQIKIICLTTNEIFNSISEGSSKYSIDKSDIANCCKGKKKSAGKHPETGERMIWMRYDKYMNDINLYKGEI